jgi:hypothetical protein
MKPVRHTSFLRKCFKGARFSVLEIVQGKISSVRIAGKCCSGRHSKSSLRGFAAVAKVRFLMEVKVWFIRISTPFNFTLKLNRLLNMKGTCH